MFRRNTDAVRRHIGGDEPLLPPGTAWAQYLQFRADHPDLEFFRLEWRIFDECLLISGSVDAAVVAARDAEGRVTEVDLVDWKTCKDIHETKAKGGKKCFLPPLDDIKETKLMTYFFQLNIYRFIIERHYGLRVRRMHILAFHDNYSSYQRIEVPRMERETRRLIQAHERELVERIEPAEKKLKS